MPLSGFVYVIVNERRWITRRTRFPSWSVKSLTTRVPSMWATIGNEQVSGSAGITTSRFTSTCSTSVGGLPVAAGANSTVSAQASAAAVSSFVICLSFWSRRPAPASYLVSTMRRLCH